MKNGLTIILGLCFAFLISCGYETEKTDTKIDERIPVSVMELKQEEFQDVMNVSGTFTTDDETILSFKSGGVIRSIFVNEGDPVHKGQLLATLDLDEIESHVNQAQAGQEKALRDYNRVSNLYKDSVATLAQFQDAKTALDVASQQLKIAKFNMNYSEIRAVQDGFVLRKFANPGQVIGSGSPVLMTNGAQSKNWILRVSVSDKDWAEISIKDSANIYYDGNSTEPLKAFVSKKSEGIDPYSGTFTIDLKVEKSSDKIAYGMFGKAEIYPKNRILTWQVPFESVIDGDGNSGFLYTTNDLKSASKIKILISRIKDNSVLISSGLENSKYLIVEGSAYLSDNSPISIIKK